MRFEDTAFWGEVMTHWGKAVTGSFSSRFILPGWFVAIAMALGLAPNEQGIWACLFLTGVLIIGAFFYAIFKTWESAQSQAMVQAVPDFTIQDLFFYLAPHLKDEQIDSIYRKVGQEILNKLSIGQLKSWGSAVGNPTQVPIEPDYWRHAKFTYLFLGTGVDSVWTTEILESHRNTNLPQYRQIWVNKNEALKIWNKPLYEARDFAILRLAKLREEGVVLRNDLPLFLPDAALDSWAGEVQEWMESVIEGIKQVSEVDSVMFTTLDTVPPARVPIPNVRLGGNEETERFVKLFREHDLRLFKLEKLIDKYRGIA